MSDDNVKLLTIYTEAALESSLIDDIEEHGITTTMRWSLLQVILKY